MYFHLKYSIVFHIHTTPHNFLKLYHQQPTTRMPGRNKTCRDCDAPKGSNSHGCFVCESSVRDEVRDITGHARQANSKRMNVLIKAHRISFMLERAAYYARRDDARRDPENYLSIITDGMR